MPAMEQGNVVIASATNGEKSFIMSKESCGLQNDCLDIELLEREN